jgi:hypothetical protein
MCVILFLTFMVLGSEVVFLQALNPVWGLFLEIVKTNEPGKCGVVSV